ncbi:SfnB family sulfur acquisition oxidoreductase [Pseudomonas aeruginosa]|uniref:SfnB family sulfur acquisition oxidoreductase n=1 Tax=Pseudomonas aeruginosa TaxID=287 RepID=UPI0005B9E931|nr:SfnB family sulfur acquisition oxidoreductase [Pseudomonas aeruginosa]
MSALEKNAADPYRQPLPRTPARRIADDAEAIRVARELAGLFAEEASLRDRQRRLPVAELEAFSQSGLWGISVPRAYGGAEVGYRTLAEVLKTIAAVDPSLAQLPQNHLAVLDHLRLDGSEEQKRFFYGLVLDGVRFGNAFSERHSRTVAEFQTRVLADGDGFRIDGRKFYSSGALLAHWVPAVGLDAEQRAHLAFIPRDAPGLTVIDDWSGFGQRTTASGTVLLDEVPVAGDMLIHNGLLAEIPSLQGAVSQLIQAAIDAGIAQAALDDAQAFVRERSRPWIDAQVERASDELYSIAEVGRLQIELHAANALLEKAGQVLDEVAARPVDAESAARASIAVAEAKVLSTEISLAASEKLFELAGSRATLAEFNLDRHWRNARTHTLHDPVRWKVHAVGDYYLNGARPARHSWI